MNVFNRYYREVQNKGFGRMVDISSHNDAVEGLPKSLDRLFYEKIILDSAKKTIQGLTDETVKEAALQVYRQLVESIKNSTPSIC